MKKTIRRASDVKGKRRKKSHGNKPRSKKLLTQSEQPPDKLLTGGKWRELDIAPSPNAGEVVPRKLRNLLAAKVAIEAKGFRKSKSLTAKNGLERNCEFEYNCNISGRQKCQSQCATDRKSGSASVKSSDASPGLKKQQLRQLVVRTIRKNSHQYEKKKSYYARRDARALERKRRRKRPGCGKHSDGSDEEGGYAMANERSHVASSPRFGEQASAPPKLTSLKREHANSRRQAAALHSV